MVGTLRFAHPTKLALRPLAPERVQAPGAGAGEGEIKKDEAVKDGGVTAVENREKSAWRVAEKIRKSHLARHQQRHRPREQADKEKRAAQKLDRAGEPQQREH